jgi:hypothetical protein
MSIKQNLLTAPESQLDASMKPLIEKWDDKPTALQILEVLDHCIYAALASGFVIKMLQTLLDIAMTNEQVKLEDLVPLATWRVKMEE